MKHIMKLVVGLALSLGVADMNALAQTAGSAKMEVTISNYVGTSGSSHYTVAWVTTEAGAFIKSLRKQGPGWTDNEWPAHCGTWNTARAGSTGTGWIHKWDGSQLQQSEQSRYTDLELPKREQHPDARW